LSRPFSSRFSQGSLVRINGKIRAREVRVIGPEGQQIGILPLHEAINLARSKDMDLVEVAANAVPPVCRVVDYGKYRYEQAKREKESKKHQHANRVKEIQLSPSIDPHDFGVKLGRAIDFLCDDMKVKVTLRFRGREMAHQEYGLQVVERLIKEAAAYGQPDAPPKLVGKGLNVMLSPLPRNRRAKNPRLSLEGAGAVGGLTAGTRDVARSVPPLTSPESPRVVLPQPAEEQTTGFTNNPFSQLESQLGKRSAA